VGCEVTVSKLRRTFRTEKNEPVLALDDVDLTVSPGRFCVLVGDSGSGKTTLLRSIAGLETPDGGDIALRGQTVFSGRRRIAVPPEDRRIGMVFQSYAIWPHLTVAENVSLPLIHGRQKVPREDARKRVHAALQLVGLGHLADRPAPQLSGGQQQRVALARAIAVSSELLLMDEPMSNLDARLREEVRNEIRAVAGHYGTTVIYVTHDQEEAMALADEIAVMRAGRILQRATPRELYDAATSREVAEFLGPMNWIDGETTGNGGVQTKIGTIQVASDFAAGSLVSIGIRPERIELAPEAADNVFAGTVTECVFLGSSRIYTVALAHGTLRVTSLRDYGRGDATMLRLPPHAVRVFARSASA